MPSVPITRMCCAMRLRPRSERGLAWRAAAEPSSAAVPDEPSGSVHRAAVHPLDARPRSVSVVLHQLHLAGVVPGPRRWHPGVTPQAAPGAARVPAPAVDGRHPGRGDEVRAAHWFGGRPVLRGWRSRHRATRKRAGAAGGVPAGGVDLRVHRSATGPPDERGQTAPQGVRARHCWQPGGHRVVLSAGLVRAATGRLVRGPGGHAAAALGPKLAGSGVYRRYADRRVGHRLEHRLRVLLVAVLQDRTHADHQRARLRAQRQRERPSIHAALGREGALLSAAV